MAEQKFILKRSFLINTLEDVLDIDIIIKAKDGDEDAKNKVFEKNIKLIHHIVNRMHIDLEKYDRNDFIQIGTIGLIKALKNYDARENVKFSTFAFPYIVGEIKMFLRDDGIIKISRNLKRINSKINELKKESNDESNIKISDIEKATGASKEDIILAMNMPRGFDSLDESESDEMQVNYKIKSNDNVEEETLQRVFIKEMIKKLDSKERFVIIKRYFYDMKQDAISKIMNISQVKVSRIEKRALEKLKILFS